MARCVGRVGTDINSFEELAAEVFELIELFELVLLLAPLGQHGCVFLNSMGEVAACYLSAPDHHLHRPSKYHVQIDFPSLFGLDFILGLEMSLHDILEIGLELLHGHLGSLPELVIMDKSLSKEFPKDFDMRWLKAIQSVWHVEHRLLWDRKNSLIVINK